MFNFDHFRAMLGSLLVAGLFVACNNETKPVAAAPATDSTGIKEETISFSADSANLNAFVVYNDSVKGKRPAVIVIPEGPHRCGDREDQEL